MAYRVKHECAEMVKFSSKIYFSETDNKWISETYALGHNGMDEFLPRNVRSALAEVSSKLNYKVVDFVPTEIRSTHNTVRYGLVANYTEGKIVIKFFDTELHILRKVRGNSGISEGRMENRLIIKSQGNTASEKSSIESFKCVLDAIQF